MVVDLRWRPALLGAVVALLGGLGALVAIPEVGRPALSPHPTAFREDEREGAVVGMVVCALVGAASVIGGTAYAQLRSVRVHIDPSRRTIRIARGFPLAWSTRDVPFDEAGWLVEPRPGSRGRTQWVVLLGAGGSRYLAEVHFGEKIAKERARSLSTESGLPA